MTFRLWQCFIQRRYRGLFICCCKVFFNFWFISGTFTLWKDIRLQPQLVLLLLLVKGDDTPKHPLPPVRCREHCVASWMIKLAALPGLLVASQNTLQTVLLQESFCDILKTVRLIYMTNTVQIGEPGRILRQDPLSCP